MTPDLSPDLESKFHSLLQRQLEQVQALTDYLDAIREAVSSNRIDSLQQMLEQGCPAFASLDAEQRALNSLLMDCGFGEGAQALHRCIQAAASTRLEELADVLTLSLDKLHKSLLINDLLIRKNQHRVRQSIRLISGRATDTQRATYSRNGLTKDVDLDQRSLATA